MPFDVEFALMYGIQPKTKFHIKDTSYRKSLAQWRQLLNTIYPEDDLNFTHPPHPNTNPNSTGDLGMTIGNRKRKPFPQFKAGNNNFIRTFIPLLFSRRGQSNAGSRGGLCTLNKTRDVNSKILNLNNLKISQNAIPFPKQILACR
jgi:hypothetical protein